MARSCAGPEIRPLQIRRAEGVPRAGPEDVLLRHVVHTHGYSKHRGKRDQVGPDVSVAERPVVRAPGVHHRVTIGERAPAGQPRGEPGGRPSPVGAAIENVVDLLGQLEGPPFRQLEHRPEAPHQVDPRHGDGHAAAGDEVRGEPAAAEVFRDAGIPRGRVEALPGFGLGDFPERLDSGPAVDRLAAGAVQGGGAGVDQMDQSASGHAGRLVARDPLQRGRAPIGPHVGEDLGGAGQEMAEEHRRAVEAVVLGGEDVRGADAVPVEGRVEDGLHEIAVGQVVGPLPLALEAGDDGVAAQGLLAEAQLGQPRIADHQVAGDDGHFDRPLPDPLLLGRREAVLRRVLVLAFLAVGLGPGQGPPELGGIQNVPLDAADKLDHIGRLDPHAQPALEEVVVDQGAGDAHRDVAQREIGFAAEGGRGQTGAHEAEKFLTHIGGDVGLVPVLHVAAIDAERRQALLVVPGQDGGQIDGPRPLRAVKAPYGLGQQRVHVHRFRAVAPAGRNGE